MTIPDIVATFFGPPCILFCSPSNTKRLDAFVHRYIRFDYCHQDQPTAIEQFDEADATPLFAYHS